MEIFKLSKSLGFELDKSLDNTCKIALLAKWLREVHRLHITIIIGYGEITWYSFIIQSIDSDSYIEDYEGSFNTYEEALEVGLFEALSLILTTKK